MASAGSLQLQVVDVNHDETLEIVKAGQYWLTPDDQVLRDATENIYDRATSP
jgi:hypothetical protein